MARAYAGQRPLGGWLGWGIILLLALCWPGNPVPKRKAVPQPIVALARASFGFCSDHDSDDCVVDGDTFRMAGETVRIADIDTAETHPARRAREAMLGTQATARLRALLNAGPFALVGIDRDRDRYGRSLRIVAREGRSIGAMLVTEGLARPYAGGHRDGWCNSV